MIQPRIVCLHGRNLTEDRHPNVPDDRPDWVYAPDRKCAPVAPGRVGIVTMFTSEDRQLRATAKRLCDRCPYQRECRDYAVAMDARHGMWGGVDFSSDHERKKAGREGAGAAQAVAA